MSALLLTALAAACFATSHDVAAGAALAASDLTEVACRADSPNAPLRYDRAGGMAVAAAPLPAGTYLGRVAPVAERQIAKGAVLTLRSAAGPVVIERQVTAMQPGRSGGRVFVRDVAGQVFAAPLELSGQ